jgi:hypothetical protein
MEYIQIIRALQFKFKGKGPKIRWLSQVLENIKERIKSCK